eukprot:SAG31_NODE_200_length_20519_cov_57.688833_2_plen_111_part_00
MELELLNLVRVELLVPVLDTKFSTAQGTPVRLCYITCTRLWYSAVRTLVLPYWVLYTNVVVPGTSKEFSSTKKLVVLTSIFGYDTVPSCLYRSSALKQKALHEWLWKILF